MKFSEQIEAVRRHIGMCRGDRAAILAQQRSRQQVTEHVREAISDVVDTAAADNMLTLKRLATGQTTSLLTVNVSAMAPHGPVHVAIDLLPVMVRLLGAAAVRKALLAGIDDLPEGLTPAERAKRLAGLDDELDTLQTQEERLIREAALDGQDIPRRPDANPVIVLAKGDDK